MLVVVAARMKLRRGAGEIRGCGHPYATLAATERRPSSMMRRLMSLAALTAVTVMLLPNTALTQPNDELGALKKDVQRLKEGQAAIQKELEGIKGLLRARPTAAAPAQEAVVKIDGAQFKGEKGAKVTLVDFTDYQ
jgi:hypothetical protein